jgi:hypothetical protein
VNLYVPYDKMEERFIFINGKGLESWMLLLTKALAKYLGSYHNLSQAGLF